MTYITIQLQNTSRRHSFPTLVLVPPRNKTPSHNLSHNPINSTSLLPVLSTLTLFREPFLNFNKFPPNSTTSFHVQTPANASILVRVSCFHSGRRTNRTVRIRDLFGSLQLEKPGGKFEDQAVQLDTWCFASFTFLRHGNCLLAFPTRSLFSGGERLALFLLSGTEIIRSTKPSARFSATATRSRRVRGQVWQGKMHPLSASLVTVQARRESFSSGTRVRSLGCNDG